jgi:hypothetical protein
MVDNERRILTEEEKVQLIAQYSSCYICQSPLENYDRDEIQFDHIYAYSDGYPQDLVNFAPVHASKNPLKLNCHKAKGRKKPVDYREELRIKDKLREITGLKDICRDPLKSSYKIADDKKSISINGKTLPLFNQIVNSCDNYYFYDEIELKYIGNDEQIQLRPLEAKIFDLIMNLKTSVQLLPSLGRINDSEKIIKIFDGQHKAVAQIVGNNRTKLLCIVFVNPDIGRLREVIYQAHTDFVQQRYKKSHIDAKLADIYREKIDKFRIKVGNPEAPFSESDILSGEGKARITEFLRSSIIDELKNETSIIREFVAQDKFEQKEKPILWQSLEKFITVFSKLDAVSVPSNNDDNFRSDEVLNLKFLLENIFEYGIKGKWSPDNPDSLHHDLSRTFFYRTAFNNWNTILEKALHFAFEQMKGKAMPGSLCYRKEFDADVKARFVAIIMRLFESPFWVVPSNQKDIASANKDSVVEELLNNNGIDYVYLTSLS